MFSTIKFYLLLSIVPFLLFSCSKEDENDNETEESKRYANFDISGGLEGAFSGENALVSVNTQPEEGTAVNWSSTRPRDEEPFWRLDFTSVKGANEELEVGTYTLGNVDDLDNGTADFMVSFQYHSNTSFPSLWGALGVSEGTMTVTEVQTGFYDNGTRDLVIGTFEFTANDNDIIEPELETIVVTNGEFRAKQGSF